MGRIRKCRRVGCDNPVPQSEGRGRPQKYCRHACKIAAFRRRCKKSGKAPRAAAHAGNDEWYTPAGVVEGAREVMGRIDLDPASTAKANETVQAKAIYTVEEGRPHPAVARSRVSQSAVFSSAQTCLL